MANPSNPQATLQLGRQAVSATLPTKRSCIASWTRFRAHHAFTPPACATAARTAKTAAPRAIYGQESQAPSIPALSRLHPARFESAELQRCPSGRHGPDCTPRSARRGRPELLQRCSRFKGYMGNYRRGRLVVPTAPLPLETLATLQRVPRAVRWCEGDGALRASAARRRCRSRTKLPVSL
jgi:hypothetical protein